MSFPTLLAESKMFDKLFRHFSAQFLCRNWTSSDVYMHKMVDIVKILTRTLNKTFQDEHSSIVFHPCVIKYFSLPDSTALQFPSVLMCNLPHKKTALFYHFQQD